jgi:hypothetical protein
MGDSGEGLVDAEAKAAERMAEREQESKRKADKAERAASAALNPGQERTMRSLELARAELTRQVEATQNEGRRDQIRKALADIETRLAEGARKP